MDLSLLQEPFLSGFAVVFLCAFVLAFGLPQTFDAFPADRFPVEKLAFYRAYYHWAFVFLFLGMFPVLLVVGRAGLGGLALLGWTFRLGPALVTPPAAALAVWLGYWASKRPDYRASYPHVREAYKDGLARYYGFYLLFCLGWESFFRGFIQLYLGGLMGAPGALMLQATASTLLHVNKPRSEVMGSALAAIFLGWLAFQTGSIVPGFLIHAAGGLAADYFCSRRRPALMRA